MKLSPLFYNKMGECYGVEMSSAAVKNLGSPTKTQVSYYWHNNPLQTSPLIYSTPFSTSCSSVMEVMVFLLLLLAMPGGSGAAWCTCRPDASDPALQKTIDYACGAGADCNPILQNGACYNPDTVLAHCSYAANSFYQRNNQAQGACDFTGTATVTATDPSEAHTQRLF
ncbi:hypothetical protein IEQ34_006558 [Dendrobium chrysotoxum]|uniref:X8 domain-containing protein n=1 Tax=Dendrobium chrysotoxum TaxID=161865 RepID=A0AAV7H781_DENCH|nr:hypothetical protein IEQ34_006558 [Dendrobium chrysotoxum]